MGADKLTNNNWFWHSSGFPAMSGWAYARPSWGTNNCMMMNEEFDILFDNEKCDTQAAYYCEYLLSPGTNRVR